MISFFMLMIPPTVTFQDKQINWKNKVIYDSAEVKTAKQKLEAHLAKHRINKPLEGPLCLRSIWIYPGEEKDPIPKTTKPDADNINKLLMDAMTKLKFWKDDAQIFDLHIQKYEGTQPGIYIEIDEFSEVQL